ncbi:DMP19 family protein [Anatilimnocola floriformis]|uniref:DMP19 family protein n=1 Tax=Anatilimnocola floriformis TaxID=2948575 RepID=UPI0020C40ABF|nr:DUF4375 domain-containing protein [Anatilimnocola floriformis]
MKATAIIVLVALVMVVSAVALVFWSRKKAFQINSFWDVVRNPELMPSSDARLQEVEKTRSSLSGSQQKIGQLVDQFVFEQRTPSERSADEQALAALGEEVYPRALEILRDNKLHERLCQLEEVKNRLPDAPLCRLCKIIDQEPPPPEAAELLTPFLRAENSRIRQSAALIVGSIGSAASLPVLCGAMADEDESVRSYVLRGLQRAIKGERIAESAKGDYYDAVASMWARDTRFLNSDDIAQILLKLDRERATQFLLSEEILTGNVRGTWQVLRALRQESIAVPRERLLSIIATADQEPLKYPLENVLRQALPMLGSHRHADDSATFERFLDYQNEEAAQGAIQALYIYHRYYDTIRDPWDVVKEEGWGPLTAVEKYICAIGQLDAEVNNGGFAQYYFNPSGDHWPEALAGLKAIGAEKRYRVMLATVEMFAEKPAVVRQTRQRQLSQLVRRQENPFRDQDAMWYGSKEENLGRLLFKYNLAHLAGRQKTACPD